MPIPPFPLWDGSHEVRLVNRYRGFDKRVRVTVEAGQTTKLIESID